MRSHPKDAGQNIKCSFCVVWCRNWKKLMLLMLLLFHDVKHLCQVMLIVKSTRSSILREPSVWAYTWEIFYVRLVEGEDPSNCWTELKGKSRVSSVIDSCSLNMGATWPAASCSCHQNFHVRMDWVLSQATPFPLYLVFRCSNETCN